MTKINNEKQDPFDVQDYAKIFTGVDNPTINSEDTSDEKTEDLGSKTQDEEIENSIPQKEHDQEKHQDDKSEKPKNNKEEDAKYLKKRLEESKAWGHKKNIAYVNAKKKVSEFLNKLTEEGSLAEEDKQNALNLFNSKDIELDTEESTKTASPFVELKDKLDKEFSIFKKYARIENADEKYNSFFYFWPLMNDKEQEETLNYLTEESSEVALDKIMSTGGELHDQLFEGMSTQGGILPYIKSLNNENKKLAEKLKKLESELDSTTGKLYNRSISSKASNLQNSGNDRSYADIWKNG